MSRVLLPIFFLITLLSGCNGASTAQCQDNAGCENQACVEGKCVDVDCLDSNECDLYQYCSDKDYTCTPGCSADTDCMAGETCDLEKNECESYGCRDTQLDCPKQRCKWTLGAHCQADDLALQPFSPNTCCPSNRPTIRPPDRLTA